MTEVPDENKPIFQAIGVVVGEVCLSDEKQTVEIRGNKYRLISPKQRALLALSKEIEATGKSKQRLVVYPRVVHFPNREQPYEIVFQLVGFDKGEVKNSISDELEDMEFKLSGLWQFIPVCRVPCISVFRNFSEERLEYIKESDVARKVKFMKPAHIPLLWKDAPVRPFRFNPRVPKEELGIPVFVSLKARFIPDRNAFGFVALTAPPQEQAPRFLKASKKDKAEVNSKKEKAQATQHPESSKSTPKLTSKPTPKPTLKEALPPPIKKRDRDKPKD